MAGVPTTMRAVLLTGHGGPEMLESREDYPVPESAANEVPVEVAVRDFVLSGRVRPVLAATHPLEDIARARADFVARDFAGKLVVTTGRSR